MTAAVFWFLGLPGSGKSTLAQATLEYVSDRSKEGATPRRWDLLDGDVIREFLGEEVGYSIADRRRSVRTVGLVAAHLARNDVGVVVANISPFEDLRGFLRERLEGYFEIYCRCPLEACIQRDPKGHYRRQLENGPKDFVGLDIPFDEPQHADLVLDTSRLDIPASVRAVRESVDKHLHRAR